MSEENVSNFKTPLTNILEILPHTNAEKLEFARVYDFHVVVQKGKFQVGDSVLYIPVDSILSERVETHLFPPTAKIKLHQSRVRQIKIRGQYSQGMLVSEDDLLVLLGTENNYTAHESLKLEEDYSQALGITKHEPGPKGWAGNPQGTKKLRDKPYSNPYFRCFNGVTNAKWTPYAFRDEEVVIQLKVHGSHIRWGKAPFVPNTIWKKIKSFFGMTPKFESVYGSNNVELTNRSNYTGFYGSDVYAPVLEKNKAFEKTKNGEFWHGEIYGPGIQSNYTYGKTEHSLIVFDCRIVQEDGAQRWLNPEEVEVLAKERGFDFVPVLHRGVYDKEMALKLSTGPDLIFPAHPREGIVIKSRYKYDKDQSKDALKLINPDYLNDTSNSDFN